MKRKQAIVRTNLTEIIRTTKQVRAVVIRLSFFLFLIINNNTLYLYGKKNDMKVIIDNQTYIISERKNPDGKPALFMLRLTGKARQYVSSLFPTDRHNVYRFDEQGSSFLLNLNDATIKPTIRAV